MSAVPGEGGNVSPGGGALTVTDGVTTVAGVFEEVVSGAVVNQIAPGVAGINIPIPAALKVDDAVTTVTPVAELQVRGPAPVVTPQGPGVARITVPDFLGDAGLGGASGTVIAPAAGDAAGLKYLFASGVWRRILESDVLNLPADLAALAAAIAAAYTPPAGNTGVPVPTAAPAGANGQFIIESFAADPDGTLETTWVDQTGTGNIANGGGAGRPTLGTASDGVRFLRFDGVANFMRRALAAVNTKNLTLFIVEAHDFAGGTIPWSLGRAGVLSNGVGCARGILGAASNVFGAEANNLGGAVAQSVAPSSLDGGGTFNTGGFGQRRAWCFQWRGNGMLTARWGGYVSLGHLRAFISLDADPPANNFTYTDFVLGAENNGGGALLSFCPVDYSYFALYPGVAMEPRVVMQELERLRERYLCV